MYQSDNINEIATALSKAQSEFKPALKDSSNPFFKSKYADFTSIVKACQEPLSHNGISFTQSPQKIDGEWVLLTKLLHSSGQFLTSAMPIIVSKSDIQSFGSAITYARRYALAAIAGVTTDDDDDGEAATAPSRQMKIVPKDDPKDTENKMIQFLKGHANEDHEMIRAYFKKYSDHWKKSLSVSLDDYQNKERFLSDFSKWKEKNQPMKATG